MALTEVAHHPAWKLRAGQNRFSVGFDRAGRFPLRLKFDAAVRRAENWSRVEFRLAPSALEPVVLRGLAPDTQFEFAGAARPERVGSDFVSYLPSDGAVKLAWNEARPEAEGKLFYAAEMLAQINVSPGLMRQVGVLGFKVMQGELKRVAVLLRGAGEVTRVQGDQVLAWNVEPAQGSADRRLVVQFNQPQTDHFALLVQVQTPLGAFAQAIEAVQLRPEGATRFAGYYRIVNEGAVRLEVAQASGLSQVSPEQFPESDATRAALRPAGSQRFVYRFSGADFALRIQADQVLPELAVSQLLAYHLGENELAIDAELELDIREAPLRELLLRVPKGYAIAQLNAAGLSDYFLRQPADQPEAELRLVYGQPISGRQVVQLRLEHNKALDGGSWDLPRIEAAKAKSLRGHVAVSADAGFRLTAERTQGLTEIATAFFPRKVAGIQAAFRLSDPSWQAALRVERLPQTVQADAFHLFSIGEGIAYGSSLINYVVSGAPVAAFKLELSNEYTNVEFTGKDIRNWQQTAGGYLVQLHTPVAGAYALLATYERPFKAQGETLAFTGARPLDAQSEQGHTLIISAYQFQVKPESVSRGLLRLDTREVPPEYRLFFDAPILAAFRYTARPFDLKLALSPLAQGDSLSLVVDRAWLTNRISKEGQVLTDARYFVKSRGNPHLRLELPPGTELWSASVNGAPVVPLLDAQANLIPLPQGADPNSVLVIDLKLAAKAKDPGRVRLGAPAVGAPVLLEEWQVQPDTGQRLLYRGGSLTPAGGVADRSGFSALARVFTGDQAEWAWLTLLMALGLLAAGVVVWAWASAEGVYRFSVRHILGALLGLIAVALGALAFVNLAGLAGEQRLLAPCDLSFLAPIQQAGSALSLEVANIPERATMGEVLDCAWPVLLALGAWVYGWLADKPAWRASSRMGGWLLLAWAALRCANGLTAFLAVLGAFLVLHAVVPALKRLFKLPAPSARLVPAASSPKSAASAATALLIGVLVCSGLRAGAQATAGHPEGMTITQPRVARHALPWVGRPGWQNNPERVASLKPFQGNQSSRLDPRVARAAQPWAECLLSLRDKGRSTAADHNALPKTDLGSCRVPRNPARILCRRRPASVAQPHESPVPESVVHQVRVEDKFALGTARIHWQADRAETLPLLFEPAVLTGLKYPTNALKLEQGPAGSKISHRLLAQKAGAFDIEVQYELPVARRDKESGVALPVPYGLVNRLKLTVVNLDVDVLSPEAVALEREPGGSNTVASLVLAPANGAWIAWQPRSRDVRRENPVFYADLAQLYVPGAGVIEGAHYVSIRPAQGEVAELVLDVPAGATITDVIDAARGAAPAESSAPAAQARSAPLVSLWRFDPDARKLRVSLNPAQSRPFTLLVRSQIGAGPLPFERSFGLLGVENSAGQIGLLGVATGNEVQLDSLVAEGFSPINLKDFPADIVGALQGHCPGLAVRRAFRYAGPAPASAGAPPAPLVASLKVSAVEPDVRVETQDTLSLGEDRTVLAANASVSITRAGIFRLSFVMPEGFDVESISGSALSHWTESRTEAGRVITLHLAGQDRRPAAVRPQPGGAGGQGEQGLAGASVGPARGLQATGHAPAGAGTGLAPPGGRLGLPDAVGPATLGHSTKGRAGLPCAADALEPDPGDRAGGTLGPGHQPPARHGQRGPGEGGRQPPVSDREHRPQGPARLPAHQRRERALPGRPGGRLHARGGRAHQQSAGLGRKASSAGDWLLPAPGQLPNPHARSGPRDAPARRAGGRRQPPARIRNGPIRRTAASAHRQPARRTPACRMAEHPTRAPAGPARRRRQFRLPARRTLLSARPETGAP